MNEESCAHEGVRSRAIAITADTYRVFAEHLSRTEGDRLDVVVGALSGAADLIDELEQARRQIADVEGRNKWQAERLVEITRSLLAQQDKIDELEGKLGKKKRIKKIKITKGPKS